MTSVPWLMIHFYQPDDGGQVRLELTFSHGKQPVVCSLTLPFSLRQVPLLLRALDARQYPDYPSKERLFRLNDIREQIVPQLQALGLWDGDERTGAVAEDVHKRVGRLLGEALFPNAIAMEYLSNLYQEASKVGSGEITLKFAPGASAFAALPWEVAHDGSRPILLARGVVLNCTRVIMPDRIPLPFYQSNKLIHVLMLAPGIQMDAADLAFQRLARKNIRDELRNHPLVEIEVLPHATMEALLARLDQGPPIQVLDYFGHGEFTDEGGALLLENTQGGRDPVNGHRLAELPNLPPLIVLQACQSAHVDIDEPLAAVATALSDAGVRAVLAMQLTIRTEVVTNIATPTFYRKLAENKSVQEAVAEMRRALYTAEPEGVSWYLPALYLRQPDQEPFVLLKRPVVYPPNPFAGQGALENPTQFIGRIAEVKSLWGRLNALGNLSIIGPPGSGKSTMLSLIMAERETRIRLKPDIIWFQIQRSMKLVHAQLMLARKLGGVNAKATDCFILLRGKRIVLLLDDIGQLDNKGDRGLEVRLWLRQLSQDRTHATVQLVSTSTIPLDHIFANDESPFFSALHNTMKDTIELGAFTDDEARQFITNALVGTPFQFQDFSDLLSKPFVPRELQGNCLKRYDELCKRDRG